MAGFRVWHSTERSGTEGKSFPPSRHETSSGANGRLESNAVLMRTLLADIARMRLPSGKDHVFETVSSRRLAEPFSTVRRQDIEEILVACACQQASSRNGPADSSKRLGVAVQLADIYNFGEILKHHGATEAEAYLKFEGKKLKFARVRTLSNVDLVDYSDYARIAQIGKKISKHFHPSPSLHEIEKTLKSIA